VWNLLLVLLLAALHGRLYFAGLHRKLRQADGFLDLFFLRQHYCADAVWFIWKRPKDKFFW
jgi:hypothetical protein